ncbi:MAG: ion transporter [Pseudomonadota bacterium]
MVQTTATDGTTFRARLTAWLDLPFVKNTILAVIIFNSITLGLATSDRLQESFGGWFRIIDRTVLTIFVIEVSAKLYAYRWAFFKSAWNIFDLVIVVLGLMPQNGNLSALRGLRVIRAMRLLSMFPQMRAVIQALLNALPGMGGIILMLSIIYYVFGVMATFMYGDAFDEWFGTVGRSVYSLFQIMTLESWSMGIVRPVMQEFPGAWAFFVPFIIITAFSVLNLFIGLLVNTMQAAVEEETQEEIEELHTLVKEENERLSGQVESLRDEIKALRAELLDARDNRK